MWRGACVYVYVELGQIFVCMWRVGHVFVFGWEHAFVCECVLGGGGGINMCVNTPFTFCS